jgi:tRNA(adenine34) deaminase
LILQVSAIVNNIDLGHLRTAIDVAQAARDHGNHPFGAILVDENNQVLLQAENTVVTESDCTGHAETNLMRLASAHFSPEKLSTCTLYTSTEPCAMCAGALIHARIARLVYGAGDPKAGAAGSVLQVINHPGLNHRMEVTAGVLAEKCSAVLQDFFRQKRQQPSC